MASTRLRALAAALAISITAFGCSSGDETAQAKASGEAAAASTTPTSTTAGADEGSANEQSAATRFAVPEEYRAKLATEGIDIADVDFPEQPDGLAWPTTSWERAGERADEGGAHNAGVADAVQAVIDETFGGDPDDPDRVDAVFVVQHGRVIAEGHHPRFDPAELHHSWSMAKSMTSALVGVLADAGRLDIFEPIGAPEWSAPGDPRSAITTNDLLHMESGLEWSEEYFNPDSDVLQVIGPQNDRAHYAANKPLEHPPGTVFEYSTGTTNIIARRIADEVGYGDALVNWIDESLFGRIGVTSLEHSLDPVGNVSGGSWFRMTVEDFARFGYLFLRGGRWDDRQLLSRDWINYSWTPTAANPQRNYGLQWWISTERPGVFSANGFDGQRIVIVPDHDLVFVVLSATRRDRHTAVVNAILDAVGVGTEQPAEAGQPAETD